MGTYDMLGTDPVLETSKGVDIDFGAEIGRFTILRAGTMNARYSSMVRELLLKPHGRKIEAGTLDEKTAREAWVRIYADTIVLGWSGVTGPDGKDLPHSREAAIRLFTDLPELFKRIQSEADNWANFRRAELAQDGDALKN